MLVSLIQRLYRLLFFSVYRFVFPSGLVFFVKHVAYIRNKSAGALPRIELRGPWFLKVDKKADGQGLIGQSQEA